MREPLLAITMGDPAGIGPEIILKSFADPLFQENRRCFVIGDTAVLKRHQKICGIESLPIVTINHPTEWQENALCVLHIPTENISEEIGMVSKAHGEAVFRYITRSISLALSQEIDGVITCPINKEALHLAGYNYPGHTEIYADKCGIKNYTMLFHLEDISVVHVTTHCSLRNAIRQIKTETIKQNIVLLHDMVQALGISHPRLAVGGLNPHAGENGLFGDEDLEEILPAVQWAQENGYTIEGPLPPDTVFMSAFKGEYDGVVSMLHDHGFVALKSRNFEDGVNITAGLPIIRTSVGHGTAFNIAGKNIASPASLLSATKIAEKLVRNYSAKPPLH